MLSGGAALSIEAVHGESVEILTGGDAGKKFIGVVEIESDAVVSTDLGIDPRSRRVIRFRIGHAPQPVQQGRIRTADGRLWKITKSMQDSYLTSDYDMIEVVAGKDS